MTRRLRAAAQLAAWPVLYLVMVVLVVWVQLLWQWPQTRAELRRLWAELRGRA